MSISSEIMEQVSKYSWLKYQQLYEESLWVVLRLFRDEYLVYLYNSQDDWHYYGVYCGQDREKAEQKYEEKLAYYRGEIKLSKPSNLLEVLNQVRLSGICNMVDIEAVIEALQNYGYHYSADYIRNSKQDYVDILAELSECVREHQTPSLAQELADEMGWEVIVD